MDDPHGLQRFVEAQDPVFPTIVAELQAGQKRTHWMWFAFPQIAGLGSSAMATRYAIGSLEEAEAYLSHDVLGPRLRLCTSLVNNVGARSIRQIFGQPDDLKFRSSMTLFSRASPQDDVFLTALNIHCHGEPDAATEQQLALERRPAPGRRERKSLAGRIRAARPDFCLGP